MKFINEFNQFVLNEGSWGYTPKDSDGCLDLFGQFYDIVKDKVDDIFKEFDDRENDDNITQRMYEIVGIIQLLLQRGFFIKRNTIKRCIEFLDKCSEEEKWINAWKNPELIKKSNEVLKIEFEKLIEDANAKEILAPINWFLNKEKFLEDKK